MVNKKNLLFSTFIGLKVSIENSSDRKLIGITGIIVDETKNMVVIRNAGGSEVAIPKVSSYFKFYLDDGEITIKGADITYRPHERAKKV
ncbi:MAG: ribonuclease P protein component 1 [Candidatus Bilamarchaeum sp.]|jgi:ribonuclease P protein subunit POP4